MHSKVAMVAGLIVLLLVNWSIVGKERHLKAGRIVYLELAPVDPRSLMQGDYMALRFRIANEAYLALPKQKKKYRRAEIISDDGRLVVSLDEKSVGQFRRIENELPLANNEILLRYRVRNGRLKFASNAFFFEEGRGKLYEAARYGRFRVDANGELLLTSLYDNKLHRLGSDPQRSPPDKAMP